MTTAPASLKFSICTIVSNSDEYALMKSSFEESGFAEDCEYIMADNTRQNAFDAYGAINWFLSVAKGEYIVIVHQDVRCIQKKQELLDLLSELEQMDPRWAVCGNAGCSGYKQCYYHLVNAGREKISVQKPVRVNSLDENFLLVKASRKPGLTPQLSGFHLYGTDICLNAQRQGHTAWVIPFLVNHLSLGNMKDLAKAVPGFLQVHGDSGHSQFIQTTCTKFYLGNTAAETSRWNSSWRFGLIKAWQRIKGMF